MAEATQAPDISLEEFLDVHIKPCERLVNNDPECAICRESYDSDSHKAVEFTHTSSCIHLFGESCIRGWLGTPGGNTCPTCRCILFNVDQKPDTEGEEEMEEEEEEEERDPSYGVYGFLGERTVTGQAMPRYQEISRSQIEQTLRTTLFRSFNNFILPTIADETSARDEHRRSFLRCLPIPVSIGLFEDKTIDSMLGILEDIYRYCDGPEDLNTQEVADACEFIGFEFARVFVSRRWRRLASTL
ncbi:hypothetical protein BDV96DRAFT_596775 [Lophiotrema nucula]|uniref:RING-type domain-containing protein n=1 Tax=Lophiotrema nucula TaxID=690887 RepID=A0A6A5ZI98_9PLEO|nr:hypothetical protein BDV96DRAFT_596775 [Lophiotrema nucula]